MSDLDFDATMELLNSASRQGKLVDRLIGALSAAGRYDNVTQDEALEAVRRFAFMVEQAVAPDDSEIGY